MGSCTARTAFQPYTIGKSCEVVSRGGVLHFLATAAVTRAAPRLRFNYSLVASASLPSFDADRSPHFFFFLRYCLLKALFKLFEIDKPHVNDLHPTTKPVELVARMVRNSSREGELVYW